VISIFYCHYIVLIMIDWYFGIGLGVLGVWTETNSASFAQASPSRLSESCRTSFLSLIRAARSGDLS